MQLNTRTGKCGPLARRLAPPRFVLFGKAEVVNPGESLNGSDFRTEGPVRKRNNVSVPPLSS